MDYPEYLLVSEILIVIVIFVGHLLVFVIIATSVILAGIRRGNGNGLEDSPGRT